ncbi:sodium/potassium-transporting ATPase subunit beta-2 [Bemisia tabaci]
MTRSKTPAAGSGTGDANGVGYEWEYARPKDDNKSKWERIALAIYNPSTNEILGRTLKSWGGLLIFYAIFYSVLALLFAICMKVLLSTLNDQSPRWQLESSIIGTNPGLGYRPMSPNVDDGSVIWYQHKNATNIKIWTSSLDTFLQGYRDPQSLPGGVTNQVICDYEKGPSRGKVCDVDMSRFGPCTSETGYGFPQSKPCIFIKLNRIYGWVPDFYNDSRDLPRDMPESLKKHIRTITDPKQLRTVWVSCHGEGPADVENVGPIKYYPQQGFPGYFYPFENTEGYLSPLVAVHFQNPKLNNLINIECRAWAKNIIYRKSLHHREGSVHFELLID